MSPEAIIERLEETKQRWWLYSLLCAIVLAAIASTGAFVVLASIDALFGLPRLWLALLFSLWGTGTIGLLVALVYRVTRRQRSLVAAARRIEELVPELESSLINVVQLSATGNGSPEPFRLAALKEAASRAERAPIDRAVERESRVERFRACVQTPRDLLEHLGLLGLLICLAWALNMFIPRWGSATQRLFRPWEYVPQVGRVKIVEVIPGETTVLAGASLEVAVRIDNPHRKPHKASLFVAPAGGSKELRHEMVASTNRDQFAFTIPAVLKPFRYRIEVGDSQTKYYKVTVVEKPAVEEAEITYEYPPYLRREKETVKQRHGDLEAPQYTQAVLRIRANVPLREGYIQIDGRRVTGTVDKDRRTLLLRRLLTNSTTYTIHLVNEAGYADPTPRVNHIRVVPDKPPSVQMVKPARELTAAPGDAVAIVVRAGDDYGLGQVRLEEKLAGQQGSEERLRTIHSWSDVAGSTASTLTYKLAISVERYRPGEELLVRAAAVDQRRFEGWGITLAPQQSTSSWVRIKVVAPEQRAAQLLAKLDNIRARIWSILQSQLRARILTAQAKHQDNIDGAQKLLREVRERQVQIQTASNELVEAIDPETSEEHAKIRRTLNHLATGEMVQAVQLADAITRIRQTKDLAEPTQALMDTQDKIIKVLRGLLDVVRAGAAEALAQMK